MVTERAVRDIVRASSPCLEWISLSLRPLSERKQMALDLRFLAISPIHCNRLLTIDGNLKIRECNPKIAHCFVRKCGTSDFDARAAARSRANFNALNRPF